MGSRVIDSRKARRNVQRKAGKAGVFPEGWGQVDVWPPVVFPQEGDISLHPLCGKTVLLREGRHRLPGSTPLRKPQPSSSQKCIILSFFIFQLQLTYNITLVSGIYTSDYTLHNLVSDHLNKSCTFMTPYIVMRILLTVFPMLYFTSHDCSITTNLYFLIELSPSGSFLCYFTSSGGKQEVDCCGT